MQALSTGLPGRNEVELDAAAVRPGVEGGAGELGIVDDDSPEEWPPAIRALGR
jgi:hypothetical protein